MSSPTLPPVPLEPARFRTVAWLTLLVLGIGLAWRLTRYFLAFPIWGDEVMLLVNYQTRGFLDIFGPIDNCQVAPLLFHWAELCVWHTLGTSELALRLPALLACLAALALLVWLARLTLPESAQPLAVGIFAVSIWPVTMGSLCKPYAFDLFFGLALIVPLVLWHRQPTWIAPLLALPLLGPLAVCCSYPAVFVAGGVGLALLPLLWQRRHQPRGGQAVLLVGTYYLLLLSAFALHYYFVGRVHLASPVSGVTTAIGMDRYWQNGFPPEGIWPLFRWLVLIHTGQMAAHPLGAASGGSSLTALAALIGLVVWWRTGKRTLVVLFVGTLLLWLLAAWLHKYPYGLSGRLSQHVGGLYCLLAGGGVAAVLARYSPAVQHRWTCGLLVVLALIGIAGITRDILRPYRDEDARWGREVVKQLLRDHPEPIVVLGEPGVSPLDWYLLRHPDRVIWTAQPDWQQRIAGHNRVVVLGTVGQVIDERSQIEQLLTQVGPGWRYLRRGCYRLDRPIAERFQECRHYHWVRPERVAGRG